MGYYLTPRFSTTSEPMDFTKANRLLGTTGLPKGILRPAGGHAVNLALSISHLFDIPGPGNTMCT